MMTLRCTGKLLERLNLPGNSNAITKKLSNSADPLFVPHTTALGDWYATILFTRPSQLILAVSEKSRLCLLLPARELSTLGTRFQAEVAELLRRIGASADEIESEVQKMSPLAFASTKIGSETGTSVNRSVLGSINDFERMVKVSLQMREWDLRDLSEDMSDTPCGPLAMGFPNKVARELLRGS